ncbi:MAG: YeeE/YedE thiosulfate transporter family protein [Thermodesulfovibrionales bacterium]
MGPLVPDIISPTLNYIVALVIGFLFGMILEQAGFSTSKKLVGLFYGYDFTVLRVFFTAGIVAMIGVMGLKYFGLLDINLVYINPTFLQSAIVGGIIMGLGFVIGGFCPGTSICAAAIGKIDAMIFILGSLIGVLIFTEGYPLFEGLYKAGNLGYPRVFETLSISENLFAFVMVVFALIAFFSVSIIERKVNKEERKPLQINIANVSFVIVSVLILIFAIVFTDRRTELLRRIEDKEFVMNYKLNVMELDEFSLCIMRLEECDRFQILDFRSEEEYKKMPFPRSTLFTRDNLFEKEPTKLLRIKHTITIFIAEDELTERKMAVLASELGYRNVAILRGGIREFVKTILNFTPIQNPANKQEVDINRFRSKAKEVISIILQNGKPQGPVKKKQKRALGGC